MPHVHFRILLSVAGYLATTTLWLHLREHIRSEHLADILFIIVDRHLLVQYLENHVASERISRYHLTMTSPYLPRHLRAPLHAYLRQFPVVLLLGARQVGKTTFLQHELKGFTAFDLEDAGTADRIAADPPLFLKDHPSRVWCDEAHRVPELFPALRVTVDRDRRPGRFVLSGSATGAMAARVSESLAGRAGVLILHPFSAAERLRRRPSPFLEKLLQAPDAAAVLRAVGKPAAIGHDDLQSAWFVGGFPEPAMIRDLAAARRWFDSYVRLVSERDLGELHRDLRPPLVLRLLRMLAARHGQMVNLASLATDFGLPVPKIRTFLELLEGTFLWKRVDAYAANIGKRLTRSPRGWIADSGLLHSLLGIRTQRDLLVHPVVGASWEGWVLEQLSAQVSLLQAAPGLAFWRTHAGAEVDIVLESGNRLIPVEVKRGTRVGPYELRGLHSFLEAFRDRAPFGVVLYGGEDLARLSEQIVLVPITKVL
jgi:predicted AAA+ superfamily ATPase